MPAEPLVGVVVPARDAERWLGAALESALAQGGARVDVVVVDDGSSDRTGAIAEAFGPPVRMVRQEGQGIGAARNRGVEEVRGDLLAFLDADDLWPPGRLRHALEPLTSRPEVDLVFGTVRQFSEIADGAPADLGPAVPAHLPAAMLIRRAAFERVGPFVTGVRVAEALDWLLRARELPLTEATIDAEVLWRRVHGQNNSVRHRADRREFALALKASLDRRRAAP